MEEEDKKNSFREHGGVAGSGGIIYAKPGEEGTPLKPVDIDPLAASTTEDQEKMDNMEIKVTFHDHPSGTVQVDENRNPIKFELKTGATVGETYTVPWNQPPSGKDSQNYHKIIMKE
jgi:hypothetical protein